jgi:hypothetical protein
MLGVLGFSVTAVLFFIFSYTIRTKNKKQQLVLRDYRRAYFLLGVTFYTYALGCISGTHRSLSLAILIGNVLLLAATINMMNILLLTNRYRVHALYATTYTGIIMIITRILYFYPTPYMQDRMLIFNSQRFVSFMLSASFLLVWLPVNLRIARMVTHGLGKDMNRIYAFLYYVATFSAIIFMLSKRPVTLVLSFVALSLSFLLLITSNSLINPEAKNHATE